MKKIYGICLLLLFFGLLFSIRQFTRESNTTLLDETIPEMVGQQEVIIENEPYKSPLDDPYPAPSLPTEADSYPAPEAETDPYPAPTSSNVTLLSNRGDEVETKESLSLNTTPESEQDQSTTSASEQTYQYFMPFMTSSIQKKGNTIFGVQVSPGRGSIVASKAKEANVSWVRYNGFGWSDVEPKRGEYNWDALAEFESDLDQLIGQGETPMVVIRSTPEWAQKIPGVYCGQMKPEAFQDFANFMSAMVKRYSGRPFDVQYWEIGNEPDIDPSQIHPREPFGCWGDQNDEFYGGGYYAEMLKVVYPAIKEANPRAKVILGGLVLDCDPTAPPEGKDCHSSRFFEGVLRQGGGDFFDIAAYHIYPFWQSNIIDPDLMSEAWQHRGGLLVGKLNYMRELMAQYQVRKPIIMNEGALICHKSNKACPSDSFFDRQANYLHRFYARGWANGLEGMIWYTLGPGGWLQGGLLDEAGNPRPSYTALTFLSQLLGNAIPNGQLSAGELEGYSFKDEHSEIQLYWSNSEQIHTIPLPLYTHAVYNKLGEPLPQSKFLEISTEPIYIQIVK